MRFWILLGISLSALLSSFNATTVLQPIAIYNLPYTPDEILDFVGDPFLPRLYLGLNTGEIPLFNITNPAAIQPGSVVNGQLIWSQPGAGNLLSGMSIHPNPSRIIAIAAYMLDSANEAIYSIKSLFSRDLSTKFCISGPLEVGDAQDYYIAKMNKRSFARIEDGTSTIPGDTMALKNAEVVTPDLSHVYRKCYQNPANGWLYYAENIGKAMYRIHGWANKNPYCRLRRLTSLKNLGPAPGETSPTQVLLVNQLTDVIYILSQNGLLTCMTGHPYSVYQFNNYVDYEAYDVIGKYQDMLGKRILQAYINARINMMYVITQQPNSNHYIVYFLDITYPQLIYMRGSWNFGPLEIFDLAFQNAVTNLVAIAAAFGSGNKFIFLFNNFLFLSTLTTTIEPDRLLFSNYDNCLYAQGILGGTSAVLSKYCANTTKNAIQKSIVPSHAANY
jgi:hypothetical protein